MVDRNINHLHSVSGFPNFHATLKMKLSEVTCCHSEREILLYPEVMNLIQKSVGEIFDMCALMEES